MPTIRLENVTKIYKSNASDDEEEESQEKVGKRKRRLRKRELKSFPAILDVNLTIEQGEFIFLVGSRGAGKSTLLEIISGDLTPDSGDVYLNDVNLKGVTGFQRAKLRRCIGKVPQESSLVRTETVMKNMTSRNLVDLLRTRLVTVERIQKSLGLVGMSGCEERYPLEFSISECRRIELAKAILHSPPILLLDEITEKMDDDTIWDMLHLLNEMNNRGTTVMMVTNAGRFVDIMRKRVIHMADGKIVGDARKGKYGYIK